MILQVNKTGFLLLNWLRKRKRQGDIMTIYNACPLYCPVCGRQVLPGERCCGYGDFVRECFADDDFGGFWHSLIPCPCCGQGDEDCYCSYVDVVRICLAKGSDFVISVDPPMYCPCCGKKVDSDTDMCQHILHIFGCIHMGGGCLESGHIFMREDIAKEYVKMLRKSKAFNQYCEDNECQFSEAQLEHFAAGLWKPGNLLSTEIPVPNEGFLIKKLANSVKFWVTWSRACCGEYVYIASEE
jgi:hypothetical protein